MFPTVVTALGASQADLQAINASITRTPAFKAGFDRRNPSPGVTTIPCRSVGCTLWYRGWRVCTTNQPCDGLPDRPAGQTALRGQLCLVNALRSPGLFSTRLCPPPGTGPFAEPRLKGKVSSRPVA